MKNRTDFITDHREDGTECFRISKSAIIGLGRYDYYEGTERLGGGVTFYTAGGEIKHEDEEDPDIYAKVLKALGWPQ